MIIGLTGKYAAGKGTVAETLEARGFRYHSLSDILREELRARGLEESRERLLAVGNELRRAGGPGALAERLVRRISDGGDHIVDSIRNPAEVLVLREAPAFHLLSIDAAPRVRFERLRARDRIGDPTTWESFQALEAKETASDDPTTQQLAATIALSDRVVDNSGTADELRGAVEALLAELGSGS